MDGNYTVVIHTIFWKSINLRLTHPSGPIRYSILILEFEGMPGSLQLKILIRADHTLIYILKNILNILGNELVMLNLLLILTFNTVNSVLGLNATNSYRPLFWRFLPMISLEAISNSSGPSRTPVTIRYTLAISNFSLLVISQVIIKSSPCFRFVSLNLSSAFDFFSASTHTEKTIISNKHYNHGNLCYKCIIRHV